MVPYGVSLHDNFEGDDDLTINNWYYIKLIIKNQSDMVCLGAC